MTTHARERFRANPYDVAESILGKTKLITRQWKKSEAAVQLGYLNGIVYLTPSLKACPWATEECFNACIQYSGRMPMAKAARLRRSDLLRIDELSWWRQLGRETASLSRYAEKLGLRPALRPNGTSDYEHRRWFGEFRKEFPEVTFYDYTKSMRRAVKNLTSCDYDITYSYNEDSVEEEVEWLLERGGKVAVVFEADKPLPKWWRGYPVVDGDEHDLTFLHPSGAVVGLRAKGRAKKLVVGGFVQPSFDS